MTTSRVEGQVYGLDVVTVVFGLLYNTAIFEEAGITTLPTTVEEWVEVSHLSDPAAGPLWYVLGPHHRRAGELLVPTAGVGDAV